MINRLQHLTLSQLRLSTPRASQRRVRMIRSKQDVLATCSPLPSTVHCGASRPIATRPLLLKTPSRNLFYLHDGNKNATDAIYFATQNGIGAHYDYAPFGAVTHSHHAAINPGWSMISANPFRFSSEYHDDELGLIYYNYRHYNPIDGRWINRDPIEEMGGLNVYAFVGNNGVMAVDWLGESKKGNGNKSTGQLLRSYKRMLPGGIKSKLTTNGTVISLLSAFMESYYSKENALEAGLTLCSVQKVSEYRTREVSRYPVISLPSCKCCVLSIREIRAPASESALFILESASVFDKPCQVIEEQGFVEKQKVRHLFIKW